MQSGEVSVGMSFFARRLHYLANAAGSFGRSDEAAVVQAQYCVLRLRS